MTTTSLERAQNASKDVRASAAEGRKTPGNRVRVGEFWYGEPGEESVILFRQATKAQLNALAAFDSSPPAERGKENKKTFAMCILWFDGITEETKAEDAIRFIDSLEEDLYPMLWGELVNAWGDHNHAARLDLRGKA